MRLTFEHTQTEDMCVCVCQSVYWGHTHSDRYSHASLCMKACLHVCIVSVCSSVWVHACMHLCVLCKCLLVLVLCQHLRQTALLFCTHRGNKITAHVFSTHRQLSLSLSLSFSLSLSLSTLPFFFPICLSFLALLRSFALLYLRSSPHTFLLCLDFWTLSAFLSTQR